MSLGLGEITTQAHGLISVGDLPAARNLLAAALADTDPRPTHATAEHADAAGLLARVMVALGESSAARAWAAYAYSANRRMHGVADERTIGAAATLAAVLHRVGSHARAAHLYREVIDELCAIDGPESLRVLAAHADLATVEFARGQCDIARDRLEDAWELHREVYGEGHPAGIKMLARLGAMQRDCGRLTESDVSLSIAIDLCRAHLPTDHPLVGQVVALAEAPADPTHQCGGAGIGVPDPSDRPDGSPGRNGDGGPSPHGPEPAHSGHPVTTHTGPTTTPAPRVPAEQSFDPARPGPVTDPVRDGYPHPNGGPLGADQTHGAANGAHPYGEDPPADGGWSARSTEALSGPSWAEPGWIDPEPPTTELADPQLAATLWAEQPAAAPDHHPAQDATAALTDDPVDEVPADRPADRHRVDPPWLGMPAPPEPMPEFDTGEPWAERGWIERDPPGTAAEDPLWSPSGWLSETSEPEPTSQTGPRDQSGPTDQGGLIDQTETTGRIGATGQIGTGQAGPADDLRADPIENGRATIPPPRVPVEPPATGAAMGPADPGAAGWLFDEQWWPPELADEEPPFAPGDGDSGSISPFGPVRYRATHPGSDPAPTGGQPPADAGSSATDHGWEVPPAPSDPAAFVPTPRTPYSAGHRAAAPDTVTATASDATATQPDPTAIDPGANGTATGAAGMATDAVSMADPVDNGAASAGTLSRLPRREVSRMPDRHRRLPVRRERGQLVPVPRPAASESRPRAPMLVFTGVVVVLLGAAAVVAGVSLVSDTSTGGPAAAPSAVATSTPPAASPPPPAPPGTPPGDIGLRDNRDSVTLTWTYPAGAEGQVLISGGSREQEPRAFMQLPSGSHSFIAYGLDQSIDYCFTVAVVYSADVIGQADPVCTDRGSAR